MLKKRLLVPVILLILLSVTLPAVAQGRRYMPAFSRLRAGWNVLTPGGSTRCADGTPYRFLVRPGATDRVLVYFEGGGACWDTNTCINLQVFDPNVTDETRTTPPPEPEDGVGIMNFDHPENPFRDYTVVYLPYCSADLFMGSNDVDYPTTPGNTVRLYHRGAHNAGDALAWLYDNLVPQSVFMAGCSAGGPGAVFFAPYVQQAYPNTRIVAFSDSSGGYRGNLGALFTAWGTAGILPPGVPGFAGLGAGDLTLERFYTAAGAAYPGITFAQFNATHDPIQPFYLELMGTSPAEYPGILRDNLLSIHSTIANFRSYTIHTDTHCITPREEFYTTSLNGVRVRDWVATLAAGGGVWNVYPDDFQLWFTPPS